MDWNTILFAARWAIIALFYFVLLVLLVGVYREGTFRLHQGSGKSAISYGRLRVVHPGSDPHSPAGTIFDLKAATKVGAEQDNDIVLEDRFVSAYHLRIRWDGAAWWLEDLNSKNGTLVNHQPVPPGHPLTLTKGAMITIGDMVMELID